MKLINRRELLKIGLMSLGALAFRPWIEFGERLQTDWPSTGKMGRVCSGKVFVRSKPQVEGTVVKEIYDDAIVPWLREVVGENPGVGSSTWVETPEGYIYAPRLQPVYNRPNQPVADLPETDGVRGMWVEVTVPYMDVKVINPPTEPRENVLKRLYHSQVVWVDDLKKDDSGNTFYRINERYGYGYLYWAAAEGLRALTSEEVAPISPDEKEKKVLVDLSHQSLSCYEGKREVYFCRISSGGKWDKDGNPSETWATPVGPHPIYRKLISLYMSGPITGNWSGVAWTSFITGEGVAIHSTYWHNEFGVPRSHGCINTAPEDAKWIFRWTYPHVGLAPGEKDVSNQWPPVGTVVEVKED